TLGTGNDQATLADLPAVPTTLDGGGGTNTLVGPNADTLWQITGTDAGTVGGVSFGHFGNLTGGRGSDTLQFRHAQGVDGTVDGGPGTDTLDYSLYTTGVTVNLKTGVATGTGGVTRIENVIGSPADDTITGDSNFNVINGNGGNDTIVGNGGSDCFIVAAN